MLVESAVFFVVTVFCKRSQPPRHMWVQNVSGITTLRGHSDSVSKIVPAFRTTDRKEGTLQKLLD